MHVDTVFLSENFIGMRENVCLFLVVEFAGLVFVGCQIIRLLHLARFCLLFSELILFVVEQR